MPTSRFIQRFEDKITGVLSGFDRLVVRGTLRRIVSVEGMKDLLWYKQILLKQFGSWAERLTEQLKEVSCQVAKDQNRPVVYVRSADTDKDELARQIAAGDGITKGLVAILTCVEPCMSFEIYRNKDKKKLDLVPRVRKCLFLYHYWIDAQFGWMNARIQSWLPFPIQICLNGREWLARMMDQNQIRYRRNDNCFTWIEDVDKAQRLMNRQLRISWPKALAGIARQLNPAHGRMFRGFPARYYWSIHQSEWATDVMFRKASDLAEIYPPMVLHGMQTFSSGDVMRFLGRKVHGNFKGEIVSDFKNRPEGVRIKHRVNTNSVKAYDKAGNVLRVETTMNDPYDFKVFRTKEGDPHGKAEWRVLRRGIADVYRRAQVTQASNERYLDALAAADTSTPLGELIRDICKPTIYRDKRVRALRPWADPDLALFRAISRGEFCVNGFRNRDLQSLLFDSAPKTLEEQRRRSARVSRLLRMLRAHHLIQKVPRTHRYVVTPHGRDLLSAVLSTHRITLEQLNKLAA
ncbi:MAG: hypothetical protein HY645_07370 [Acidobacteria bacterium]|nr:hypothetical protein [Acidobacteriota bacterium]